MKGKDIMMTSLIVLLVGVVLIITCDAIKSAGVVIVGGILFILAGVINVFLFEGERKRASNPPTGMTVAFSRASSGAAVILGLSMLFFTVTFTVIVPFLFGLVVLAAALYQFYILAYRSREASLTPWLYVAPVLMVGAAIYVFLQPADQAEGDKMIMLISGIALALYGVVGIVEAAVIGRYNRSLMSENETHDEKTGATSHLKAELPPKDSTPRPMD